MRTRLALIFLLLCSTLIAQQSSPASQSRIPHLIRFSGTLKDLSNKPLSGVVGVTISLYSESSAGSPVWTETQNVKLDEFGKYNVLLGATKPTGMPLDLFSSGASQWLGVRAEGQPEQPRILLVSVPYALHAAEAETLAGHSVSDFVTVEKLQSTVQHELDAASQAPTTTKPPTSPVRTQVTTNPATNFADSNTSQVVKVAQSGSGLALSATAASGIAIRGTSASIGLFGSATATSGIPSGVEGLSVAPTGMGVYGVHSATTGGGKGVEGLSSSPQGFGVFGYNTATTDLATGVLGRSNSTSGIGIRGSASATSGPTMGVLGIVNSATGIPIVARNGAGGKIFSGQVGASNYEVFSVDGSGDTRAGNMWTRTIMAQGIEEPGVNVGEGGVFRGSGVGYSDLGYDGLLAYGGASIMGVDGGRGLVGVGGNAAQGNGGFGIYAVGGTSDQAGKAPAGYFSGNITVTGTVNAASASSQLDHPLDPANKLFSHASMQSNEMKNFYDGIATFDDSGSASVTLPEWFEALNADFRYQLTPIGGAFVPFIQEEINAGHFKISGGLPGKKVSWQVTGVRKDPYAKAHPLQVEVEKPQALRGTFLNPELYGAPADKQSGVAGRSRLHQHTTAKP